MIKPLMTPAPPAGLRNWTRKMIFRSIAGLVLLGCLLVAYWVQFFASYQAHLRQAEILIRMDAATTAHAMSQQVATILRKLDFMTQQLSDVWSERGASELRRAVTKARRALPDGALAQVAVADQNGDVVFSDLWPDDPSSSASPASISIADREHFRVHLNDGCLAPRLFVSRPVLGRISLQWTVQLSRPLCSGPKLMGVIVISITAQHLSQALHDLFPEQSDIAAIVREDGEYLARSTLLDAVMGQSVPATRPFLSVPDQEKGEYEAKGQSDGVLRYFAWHRTPGYPVLTVVGLNKDEHLASVLDLLRDSVWRNAIGTVLLLLAGIWIARVWAQRIRQSAELMQTSERLELALQGGNLGAWDWDLDTNNIEFSEHLARMFGFRGDEVDSAFDTWNKQIHPDDWPKVQAALLENQQEGNDKFEAEYRIQHKDGHWLWVRSRGHVVGRHDDLTARRMVGTMLDVTAKHEAESALLLANLRLTTMLERFPGGVLMEGSNGEIISANEPLCELLCIKEPPAALVGLSHDAWCERLGEPRASWFRASGRLGRSDQSQTLEVCDPNGRTLEIRWVQIVQGAQHLGIVWLLQDLTERKRYEGVLVALAETDALTGLSNRRSFVARLESALADAPNHPESCGVLLMADIDHFKLVNDTYGHPIGDCVLQHVAKILAHSFRKDDIVGRLGGEEFGILLPNVTLADALIQANRVRETLAETPSITTAGEIVVTISIGLAGLNCSDSSECLNRADKALYDAKNTGRNRVCVWRA